MSLYKKMHEVMVESEALSKDLQVGVGNSKYKAISEAQVLNAIKPLFKKHKLILFPIEVDVTEESTSYEVSNKYGTEQRTRLMTSLKAKYKIVDIETGEFEILATVGNGVDPQDKGSGKAMTYALKALLQKTFMLFSGEDTDNEHSNDITEGMKKDKNALKDDQLSKILELLDVIQDKSWEKKILQGYKVKSLEELNPQQASGTIKRLTEVLNVRG